MMNTSGTDLDSTGLNLSTVAEAIEGDYSPPVKMIVKKDGRVRYVPVKWEKNLIMYDLTLIQDVYSDGSIAELRVSIKIDGSKNVIRNRFDILDIREEYDIE